MSISDTYVKSVAGVPVPLHGCWRINTQLNVIRNSLNTASEYVLTYFALLTWTFILTQKRIIRATTTAIEVLLTFIRFTMTYKTQRIFSDGVPGRISHMKTSTRLLYVFYRDGTLLFIP